MKEPSPHYTGCVRLAKSRQDAGFVGILLSRRRRRAGEGQSRGRDQIMPIGSLPPPLRKLY